MRKSKVEALIKEAINSHENIEHVLRDYKEYDKSDFPDHPSIKDVLKLLCEHFRFQIKEQEFLPPYRIVEKD